MPVLDEAAVLGTALASLSPLAAAGAEVIVVDGGSRDSSLRIAEEHGCRVVSAPRGRAAQMNAGAQAARSDAFVFLHADTKLPGNALDAVRAGLAGHSWGRFDVTIEGAGALLALVAAMMNLRSRLTGIATGDQAMFVARSAFAATGGFPDIALMEDIALSRRLKRLGRPLCLRARVTTSGRRWETHGVARTILTMWRLRLAFFFGAAPAKLAVRYGYVPRQS